MTFLMPSGVFGDENGSLAPFNREHFRVTMEIVHYFSGVFLPFLVLFSSSLNAQVKV
jgi:hypothetical protein